MAIRFFTNGTKTVRADGQSAPILLQQENDKGKPIWAEIEDPDPPKQTEAEVAAADHTGQIEIKHTKTGKISWCDKGQCVAMLDSGWELVVAGSFIRPDAPEKTEQKATSSKNVEQPKKVEQPVEAVVESAEEAEVSDLRKVLEGLDHVDDFFWNSKGEINITSLRTLVPNVTRKEVEEAFPGFVRSKG